MPSGIRVQYLDDVPMPFVPIHETREGLMGIVDLPGSTDDGRNYVLARGLPDNVILFGERDDTGIIKDLRVLMSSQLQSRTHHGYAVLGYEDPTYVPPSLNVWEPGKPGLLCSQTYMTDKDMDHPAWPDCCTVYYGLDGTGEPRVVLTDEMIEKAGLTAKCTSVKEPEFYLKDGELFIWFEYNDVDGKEWPPSNVGVCRVDDRGDVVEVAAFHPAAAGGVEHLSPVDPPFQLSDGSIVVFLNRGFWGPPIQWGLTACVAEGTFPFRVIAGREDWLVPPPLNLVINKRDPGMPAIVFASQVLKDGNRFEFHYHLDDSAPRIATLEVEGIEVAPDGKYVLVDPPKVASTLSSTFEPDTPPIR